MVRRCDGVCVSTGEVLVTDTENRRVVSWRIADGGGLHAVCGGVTGWLVGQCNEPASLVVSHEGALWVARGQVQSAVEPFPITLTYQSCDQSRRRGVDRVIYIYMI
jgi:hypothetical protein